MLLRQLLLTALLFFLSPVWADFTQLLAGLESLAELADQDDEDVNDIVSVDGVTDPEV